MYALYVLQTNPQFKNSTQIRFGPIALHFKPQHNSQQFNYKLDYVFGIGSWFVLKSSQHWSSKS